VPCWSIEIDYGVYSLATSYSSEESHWWFGWYSAGRSATGAHGAYSLTSYVFVDGDSSYWQIHTGATNNESDGWYQKKVIRENEECPDDEVSVTYIIDGKVKLQGTLRADNQRITDGRASFYGNAEVILTGLASGSGDVEGQFNAEENESSVGISIGPINTAVSFWANDVAVLEGEDLISAGNTVLVPNGSFIRWRGSAKSWAQSLEAAETALGTVETVRQTFDLTINE
jgi:hypothetical protein